MTSTTGSTSRKEKEMSSYFDEAAREAAEGIESAKATEERVKADVLLVAGDREFPDDLRQHIVASIAIWAIDTELHKKLPELLRPAKGKEWYEAVKASRMIEELHTIFHELASRKIETRFGILSDRPTGILHARTTWIEEQYEQNIS